MPDTSDHDPFDSTLTRLFQAERSASPDFTASTLARVRAAAADEEAWVESWLEAELAANPVEASPGFSERTRWRIEREKAPLIRFPFPLFVRTAAGIAAAVALLFAVGRSDFALPAPSQEVADATPVEAAPAAPEVDPAMATLLVLADGLDRDARWLLRGEDNAALLALAR